jgi:hypothetical protein
MSMAYQVFEPENAGGMAAAAQVALAAPGEDVPPGDMTISYFDLKKGSDHEPPRGFSGGSR